MEFKYGKRSPKNAPAISLSSIISTIVIPTQEDYLSQLSGSWDMLGNDQYGDCVAVTWANVRRFMVGGQSYPSLDDVIKLYKTQNPNFPSDDNGMDIQTCLEYLIHNGGPDGIFPVAFAKVNHADLQEVQQALAIFGYIWTGINVLAVNETEFDQGQPWNYVNNSPSVGGHSVISGGYDSGYVDFITWAQETKFTDDYWKYEVDEAWVVIWPEHFSHAPFLNGVDQAALADYYQHLTGNPLPLPNPTPTPIPVPTPGAAPFLGCDPYVAAQIERVANKHNVTTSSWMNKHFTTYFRDSAGWKN